MNEPRRRAFGVSFFLIFNIYILFVVFNILITSFEYILDAIISSPFIIFKYILPLVDVLKDSILAEFIKNDFDAFSSLIVHYLIEMYQ